MNDLNSEVSLRGSPSADTSLRRRSLIAACGAHAVHDGLTDVIYVLLPIWQAQFAISFAMVGLLRGAYSGMMAGLMAMLPLLGLALNGTSSVLYGVVPELAAAGKREQAFALFYTGTIGGGALSPVLFGRLGDVAGVPAALTALAAILLSTLPLSWYVQKGLDG